MKRYLKYLCIGIFVISIISIISIIMNIIGLYYFANEFAFAKSVPVLLYHDVDTIEKQANYYPGNFISIENFEEQMQFLKANNYKTLTLDEFYDFVQNKKKIPKRSVLITFDTGRKNVKENAYPILKKHKFHAAYFLLTKAIKDNSAKNLSQKDLNDMSDVFEYAHHTHDLHYLLKKGDFKSSALLITPSEEIKKDILKSMKYVNSPYFAYPYGRYNKHVIQTLKEIGIKAAFSTKRGRVYPGNNLYTLSRNPISQKCSFKKFLRIIGHEGIN